jgi:hypothetical protein
MLEIAVRRQHHSIATEFGLSVFLYDDRRPLKKAVKSLSDNQEKADLYSTIELFIVWSCFSFHGLIECVFCLEHLP